LRGELASDRYGSAIRARLEREGLAERIITNPVLDDDLENRVRLGLLTGYRDDYFDDFPDDVSWQWMAITRAELATVRCIDYSYWNKLSGGTCSPVDAAPRIRAGIAPYGVSSDRFLRMAQLVSAATLFPPLILVTTGPGEELVVLEGHNRLTAYLLVPDQLPPELEVLVGYSSAMTHWLAISD
jgi:hypothetical protein